MIQKLKIVLLSFGAFTMFLAPAVAPAAVYAQQDTILEQGLCKGANLSVTDPSCAGTGTTVNDFQATLNKLVNIISIIVGIVAVLMIIYGGFRYITSGGDATKVTSAKNTILYGLIGLIIVALAQIIVKFVIRLATDAPTP